MSFITSVRKIFVVLLLPGITFGVARFKKVKKPDISYRIKTDMTNLGQIAHDSSTFLKRVHLSKYVSADEGLLKGYGVTLEDVVKTLDFIETTVATRPELLKSHWFLKKNFDFYRWYADKERFEKSEFVIPKGDHGAPEHIRVTKYRIAQIKGSSKKTKQFSVPLYQKPSDETGKTPHVVLKNKDKHLRFKFSKKQILNGSLQKSKKTKILAWVTPDGYKDFAMQGSIAVALPEKNMMLNVGGHNGQNGNDRYWFAVEVQPPSNIKTAMPVKVRPIPGVSFAGNIKDLGFGKLILLQGRTSAGRVPEIRLGVLVDTGSAFKDNLFQLDLFSGYFESETSFKEYNGQFPETAQAYILIKK